VSKSTPVNRLWWLTYAPSVWAAHLLASYLTAAIFCAKSVGRDADAGFVRWVVVVITVVALAVIGWVGTISYRHHRLGDSTLPHDFDSPQDQLRFIGFAAFLLSLLSGIATLFTATVFLFMGSCH
jgi:hypothetical protein